MLVKTIRHLWPAAAILFITILACNIPGGGATPTSVQSNPVLDPALVTETPAATPTVAVIHSTIPSEPPGGKLVYDVESQSTAPELRAPYGDSYDINRLERPFQQNMTYVSDLDILTFMVAGDTDWWYVTVELIGSDPNNSLGIHYGVELDLDFDGFGNYLILAHPPYTPEWDTAPVQIYQDQNHNTGGLSGEKSDAPLEGDGYETMIFNGGVGDADPDLAWVRANASGQPTVQFAFKKSWSGAIFMLGVLADAGLKDNTKLDYVDRFTIAEAGSPVRDNKNYPLKDLYLVDNTCREAFGFKPTRYEPQICPPEGPPAKRPKEPGENPPGGCQPPPGGCGSNSDWYAEPYCVCSPF